MAKTENTAVVFGTSKALVAINKQNLKNLSLQAVGAYVYLRDYAVFINGERSYSDILTLLQESTADPNAEQALQELIAKEIIKVKGE